MKRFWSMAIALAALPLSPAVAKPSDWLPWNWGDGGEAGQAENHVRARAAGLCRRL